MKMYRVENNQIVQYSIPKTFKRLDGTTVSGYDLLPLDELKKDGWLEVEENIPQYNENTQYIVEESTEILEDKIVVNYRVEDIPEPIEEIKVDLESYMLDLEFRVSMIELGL